MDVKIALLTADSRISLSLVFWYTCDFYGVRAIIWLVQLHHSQCIQRRLGKCGER